ncbi:MAG: ATP-grasp protein [Thermoproteota archaeon]|nr:ATP-grasp protein [Thermoproteota archaeon]
MEKTIHSILIIGLDVTSLAKSASEVGYKVYSIDYFGDSDLKRACVKSYSIICQQKNQSCKRLSEQFSPEYLLKLVRRLVREFRIEGAILSSGLEDSPEIISELGEYIPIIGNDSLSIKRVRDRLNFFRELESLGILHPSTRIVDNVKEAMKQARDIGYPVILKPEKGSGGGGVEKVSHSYRLESAFNRVSSIGGRVLIQEYTEGIPVSVSLISIPGRSMVLSVNEQLMGMRSLGQHNSFNYCGSIVPLSARELLVKKCERIAERIVNNFRLIGSNGVDFVLSSLGEPCVIEINPRFQGTFECVERVLGVNLLEAHIRACVSGILPQNVAVPRCVCTRLILYAKKRSKVPDLNGLEGVQDIPFPGVIVEKGEPVCSAIAEGISRVSSLRKARDIANHIYSMLQ